ncbi:MAG: acetyl-CoA carboxylase carboxyl transferase subunit alpha, partial [Prosthecobacter sp.]
LDDVISEPTGGAHHNHQASADAFRKTVLGHIAELSKLSTHKLLEERYAKFRAFGEWQGK